VNPNPLLDPLLHRAIDDRLQELSESVPRRFRGARPGEMSRPELAAHERLRMMREEGKR
jgi:hypothetical protein